MHRLYDMKNCLISAAQSQMGNLQDCNAEELGEVIDMIKDLEEAIYYCTITKSMNDKEENNSSQYRMYYKERGGHDYDNSSSYINYPRIDKYNDKSNEHYREREFPLEMRDAREGRSPARRRMYMESKELHKDKVTAMKELEEYMQELSSDICEMIEDASPEEKQLLQKKIIALSNKIQ